MTRQIPRFGPLTFGVALGAFIGFAVAMFGLCALQAGTIEEDDNSVLLVAFGAATIGLLLGLIAEFLLSHPTVAAKPWVRHALRPITFCSLPYILLAMSLGYFGYDKLMGGFGFWFCVLCVPVLGITVAWRRRVDPAFDQRFQSTTPEHNEVR